MFGAIRTSPRQHSNKGGEVNDATRQELKEFVQELIYFAHAVSSVAGTNAVADLDKKAEALMNQLNKDPTIV